MNSQGFQKKRSTFRKKSRMIFNPIISSTYQQPQQEWTPDNGDRQAENLYELNYLFHGGSYPLGLSLSQLYN